MKKCKTFKNTLLIFLLITMIFSTVSCDIKDATDITTDPDEDMTTDSNEAIPTNSQVIDSVEMAAYRAVLKNEVQLFDVINNTYLYFNECKFPYFYRSVAETPEISFYIIDMDNDGIVEIIINDGFNGDSDKIVLHYYNGIVYCYTFTFRGMYYVQEDGVFYWTGSGGSEYGSARLLFIAQYYKWISLSSVIYNKEVDTEYCYISDIPVTLEECVAYAEAQQKTPRIKWYEFNSENLEKYIGW